MTDACEKGCECQSCKIERLTRENEELRAELSRANWKAISLMTAGDRLLDHVVTQHHPEDVREWWRAKEL